VNSRLTRQARVPASGADLANLIVWSFVAGFAERFVPDVLTRLASTDTGQIKKS
jgi:hypothetical protein